MANFKILFLVALLVLGGCIKENAKTDQQVPQAKAENISGGDNPPLLNPASPVNDNVEYLKVLGLMRGHLIAFTALHEKGLYENAQRHAKHPESELYTQLKAAFEVREIEGFAPALTTLADVALSGGDIKTAYQVVLDKITRAEDVISAKQDERLLAIAELLREAGREYAIGVDANGEIKNLHEYQDAYGFTHIAKDKLMKENFSEVVDLSSLDQFFTGWTPKALPAYDGENIAGEPALFRKLAVKVELLARRI